MRKRATLLGGTIGLLWLVQIVNFLLGYRLDAFGVVPRTLSGLAGIVFAPFLHASFAHLIANSISMALIGGVVMLRRARDFFTVSALSALTAGLGAWLLGASGSVHVGASGAIFGLLGYLFSRGFFERKILSIVGSVAAIAVFGGMLTGLLPGAIGISWQSHLFGFLGGVLAARLGMGAEPAKEPERRARVAVKTRVRDDDRIAIEEEEERPRLAARRK